MSERLPANTGKKGGVLGLFSNIGRYGIAGVLNRRRARVANAIKETSGATEEVLDAPDTDEQLLLGSDPEAQPLPPANDISDPEDDPNAKTYIDLCPLALSDEIVDSNLSPLPDESVEIVISSDDEDILSEDPEDEDDDDDADTNLKLQPPPPEDDTNADTHVDLCSPILDSEPEPEAVEGNGDGETVTNVYVEPVDEDEDENAKTQLSFSFPGIPKPAAEEEDNADTLLYIKPPNVSATLDATDEVATDKTAVILLKPESIKRKKKRRKPKPIRLAQLSELPTAFNHGPREPRIFEGENIKISNIKLAKARGSAMPISIVYVWDKKGNYVGRLQRFENKWFKNQINPKYKKWCDLDTDQLIQEGIKFAEERFCEPDTKIESRFVTVSDRYIADGGIDMVDVYVDMVSPCGDKYKYLICRLYVQSGYKTDWELYKCAHGVSADAYKTAIGEAIKLANENLPGITDGNDIYANGNKVNLSCPYTRNVTRRAKTDMDAVVDDVKLVDVYDKKNQLIGRLYRYSDAKWRVFDKFTSTIPNDELDEYIAEAISLANINYPGEPIAKNGVISRIRNRLAELKLNNG